MIIFIGNVLSASLVEGLRGMLERTRFVDGRETAGEQARQVKRNDQVDSDDSLLPEMREIVLEGLAASDVFHAAARPKDVRPPMFSRYVPGMEYGNHVDDALMGGMRTDLALTLFLSAPETYDGGELVIDGASGEQRVKLPAGSAVLYPATTLHRVAPVTRGERLAAVTWIRSLVRDPGAREILFDLETVAVSLFGKLGKTAETDLLSKTQANLLRRWVED